MAEKPEADPDRSAGLYRPIAKALLVAYGVAMVSVTATVAGWWDTGPVRPLMIGALQLLTAGFLLAFLGFFMERAAATGTYPRLSRAVMGLSLTAGFVVLGVTLVALSYGLADAAGIAKQSPRLLLEPVFEALWGSPSDVR